jgi:hypothetical protein
MTSELTPADQASLEAYRRQLRWMMMISSGVDALLFVVELPANMAFLGGPFVLDEIIEVVISTLLAGKRLKLNRWYKLGGLIPVPGVTALSLQCWTELRRCRRHPDRVLASLREAAPEPTA